MNGPTFDESVAHRHKDGYAKITARYDERGTEIERAYWDKAGKPAGINAGYTRIIKVYDAAGKLTEDTSWGFDGWKGWRRTATTTLEATGSKKPTSMNLASPPDARRATQR